MTRSKIARNAWVECPTPHSQARLRLFCFPYSGAGASIFYTWASALPATIEVCPIQLPGRGTRLAEPLFTRLQPLVQAAARALVPCLDKPFAFFGHSMGALVSFELARYLCVHHDLSPARLLVSGHNAPQVPNRHLPIHSLPDVEFVEELRSLNGMPEEVLGNAELMELLLPILRADFALCETYVYEAGRPLDCPISAFGGLRDPYISRQGLEAWCEQTTATFSLHMFPGGHATLNTARSLLLRMIARELETGLMEASLRGQAARSRSTPGF